jgi:DNA-binding transcriptional LysR family regulator
MILARPAGLEPDEHAIRGAQGPRGNDERGDEQGRNDAGGPVAADSARDRGAAEVENHPGVRPFFQPRQSRSDARWLEYPHVIQRLGNDQMNTVEAELLRRGLHRRVGLEAPSFLAGLFVVATSDMLMNAPIPLVNEAARKLRLTTREAPLRLPRVRLSLCWHECFQADPAHRWARERVFEIAKRAFE